MIDEGELDWKIIAISLDDPKASLVNDVEDVEKHFPVCCFLLSSLSLPVKCAVLFVSFPPFLEVSVLQPYWMHCQR